MNETPTPGPDDLTPVELRSGMWYKREDAFSLPSGVNGSKLRACLYLARRAQAEGAMEIVSAASVLSPQSAMAAAVAQVLDMTSVTIVGGTTPDKAVANKSIRMAKEAGSEVVRGAEVGYNTMLQAAGRSFVAENPGSWQLPYGITTPSDSSPEDIVDFLAMGAAQVANLPDEIDTLVLPFGSGNTAAGVLYGLETIGAPSSLKRVVLMTIGPDRRKWLDERLARADAPLTDLPFELEQVYLHPFFAEYGDSMRETMDGIKFHPTYEGKVVRYLNLVQPEWWAARDGKTLLWIVGGPLP